MQVICQKKCEEMCIWLKFATVSKQQIALRVMEFQFNPKLIECNIWLMYAKLGFNWGPIAKL